MFHKLLTTLNEPIMKNSSFETPSNVCIFLKGLNILDWIIQTLQFTIC